MTGDLGPPSDATGSMAADGGGVAATSRVAVVAVPPRNRMFVAVLALVGVFLAFYLVAHNLGWSGPIQCGTGDCGTVQSSSWAWVGPVPVSGIGLAGYLSLFVLAVLGLQPRFAHSRAVAFFLLGGALVGVLFSAWLTYLEAFVIRAWCRYCVASAVAIALVFAATLPEWKRLRPRRPAR